MPVPATSSQPRNLRECLSLADAADFQTAVSLHAHTDHSREIMADLPAYIARIPIVAPLFERELRGHRERDGRAIDFSKGW